MDLNEIYVFTKVVELGSFTKAADFLKIPKSRISRRVSSLEKNLGVQLLFRTTRQLELTPAGRKYYSKSHQLIADIDSLNTEISSTSDDISGLIRITAPEDIALRFFPKMSSEFMRMHPNISFDFYLTGRKVDLIKEPIDLALRVGFLKDSSLKSRKIGELASILVATPSFLSIYNNINTIQDLEKIPAVGFGQNGKAEDWVLNFNKKQITIRPHARILTNTMDVLLSLVLESRGIALMPSFIAEEKIKSGELIHLFKGHISPSIPLHFLTAPQKEMPLKVRKFIDFAIEKLALTFK